MARSGVVFVVDAQYTIIDKILTVSTSLETLILLPLYQIKYTGVRATVAPLLM